MDVPRLTAAQASAAAITTSYATLPTPVLGAVADRLGISVDALRAQLAAGKPLSTIATVAGLAHEELAGPVRDREPGTAVDLLL